MCVCVDDDSTDECANVDDDSIDRPLSKNDVSIDRCVVVDEDSIDRSITVHKDGEKKRYLRMNNDKITVLYTSTFIITSPLTK